MKGNGKGSAAPLEYVEHSNESCEDRTHMIEGEEEDSLSKNISDASEGGGVGAVKNNCRLIIVISSTGVPIGNDLCNMVLLKRKESA